MAAVPEQGTPTPPNPSGGFGGLELNPLIIAILEQLGLMGGAQHGGRHLGEAPIGAAPQGHHLRLDAPATPRPSVGGPGAVGDNAPDGQAPSWFGGHSSAEQGPADPVATAIKRLFPGPTPGAGGHPMEGVGGMGPPASHGMQLPEGPPGPQMQLEGIAPQFGAMRRKLNPGIGQQSPLLSKFFAQLGG